jgi:hypothetical protein
VNLSGVGEVTEPRFGQYAGPANVSRLHESVREAREGVLGQILFQENAETKLFTNSLFDSSLISYDLSYCTTIIESDGKNRIPTLSYFNDVLNKFESPPLIIDIGCGQGEFVDELRQRGLSAFGYDPVLRNPNLFLFNSYWTEKEIPGDLYVMRCVLPHIEHPFDFLESIWSVNLDALVLVEYQSWSWMCRNSVWNQICHDHVHQFSSLDFLERNLLIDSGTFEEGEWEWVLLGKTSQTRTENFGDTKLSETLTKLDFDRETSITRIMELAQDCGVVTVWGGLQKGRCSHTLSLIASQLN